MHEPKQQQHDHCTAHLPRLFVHPVPVAVENFEDVPGVRDLARNENEGVDEELVRQGRAHRH